jgi:hypothetical protein
MRWVAEERREEEESSDDDDDDAEEGWSYHASQNCDGGRSSRPGRCSIETKAVAV